MKKTAFLGLLLITTTMLAILGCGQSTVGKYSGQGVITLKGKALQQPVTLDITERLYKDYEGSYTLQTSNYQGTLQLRRADGELKGRTMFQYTHTDAAQTTCQVELTGTFETVEDTMSGKLCGKDYACAEGGDICVEFKALKRTNNDPKKTQNDWWTNPTTTINNGGAH